MRHHSLTMTHELMSAIRPSSRNSMPEGSRGLLDALPALRKGECIISGEGVALPIRAMLDLLPADKRPHSSEPSFSRSGASPPTAIRHWSAPSAAGAISRPTAQQKLRTSRPCCAPPACSSERPARPPAPPSAHRFLQGPTRTGHRHDPS